MVPFKMIPQLLLIVIIDSLNQPWLHRNYIDSYPLFVTNQVQDDYYLMKRLPPVKSLITGIDNYQLHLNFITVDNRWIQLDYEDGLTEIMTGVISVDRQLNDQFGVVTHVLTMNHELVSCIM